MLAAAVQGPALSFLSRFLRSRQLCSKLCSREPFIASSHQATAAALACDVGCRRVQSALQKVAVHRLEQPMLGSHAVTILNFMESMQPIETEFVPIENAGLIPGHTSPEFFVHPGNMEELNIKHIMDRLYKLKCSSK